MTDDSEPEVPRRRPVQREHLLQVAIRQFARDAIDLSADRYMFMAIDSAQKATDNQRARMVARGIVPGAWDTVLFVRHCMPLWAEIKVGRNKLSRDQIDFGSRVEGLGHAGAMVSSVQEYGSLLMQRGVPLRLTWVVIAADLDLKVQARITKAEARVATPGSGRVKAAPRYTPGKRAYARGHAKGLF